MGSCVTNANESLCVHEKRNGTITLKINTGNAQDWDGLIYTVLCWLHDVKISVNQPGVPPPKKLIYPLYHWDFYSFFLMELMGAAVLSVTPGPAFMLKRWASNYYEQLQEKML